MRKYTKQELDDYWMARCTECGWRGLSCDCGGFDPIADTGDYSDGTCPRCDSVIDEYECGEYSGFWAHGLSVRMKWAWRFVTFWALRCRFQRGVCVLAYCIAHGLQPEPPKSLRERVELFLARRIAGQP